MAFVSGSFCSTVADHAAVDDVFDLLKRASDRRVRRPLHHLDVIFGEPGAELERMLGHDDIYRLHFGGRRGHLRDDAIHAESGDSRQKYGDAHDDGCTFAAIHVTFSSFR